MDSKEKVIKWIEISKQLDQRIDELNGLLGCDGTSPLHSMVYSMHAAYTDAISREIGDSFEWLNWFYFENGLGERGMEAGDKDNIKPIKTVDDLLELIEG